MQKQIQGFVRTLNQELTERIANRPVENNSLVPVIEINSMVTRPEVKKAAEGKSGILVKACDVTEPAAVAELVKAADAGDQSAWNRLVHEFGLLTRPKPKLVESRNRALREWLVGEIGARSGPRRARRASARAPLARHGCGRGPGGARPRRSCPRP